MTSVSCCVCRRHANKLATSNKFLIYDTLIMTAGQLGRSRRCRRRRRRRRQQQVCCRVCYALPFAVRSLLLPANTTGCCCCCCVAVAVVALLLVGAF